MYVCCVYINVCLCLCVFVFVCTYVSVYMYVCMYVRMYVCNRYSMAVSDVWHIHVPRPEGRSPEGEGVYMPYITSCHAICYINPV